MTIHGESYSNDKILIQMFQSWLQNTSRIKCEFPFSFSTDSQAEKGTKIPRANSRTSFVRLQQYTKQVYA